MINRKEKNIHTQILWSAQRKCGANENTKFINIFLKNYNNTYFFFFLPDEYEINLSNRQIETISILIALGYHHHQQKQKFTQKKKVPSLLISYQLFVAYFLTIFYFPFSFFSCVYLLLS